MRISGTSTGTEQVVSTIAHNNPTESAKRIITTTTNKPIKQRVIPTQDEPPTRIITRKTVEPETTIISQRTTTTLPGLDSTIKNNSTSIKFSSETLEEKKLTVKKETKKDSAIPHTFFDENQDNDSKDKSNEKDTHKPLFGYDEVDTGYYTFKEPLNALGKTASSSITGNFSRVGTGSFGAPPITGSFAKITENTSDAKLAEETAQPLAKLSPAKLSPRVQKAEHQLAEVVHEEVRRGTIDIGILFLRVGIASYLIFKSLQWFFRFWGGCGISGLQKYLENPSIAFDTHYTMVLSWVFPIVFLLSGLTILCGILTPVGGAAALCIQSLLIVCQIVHQRTIGIFDAAPALPTSTQFPLAIAIGLIVLILIGPGLLSFDHARSWARRPYLGSIAAVVLGLGAAMVIWTIFNGHDPLSALQ